MIELPEAVTIANQLHSTIVGKTVHSVTSGQTPHKLAWYYGDRSKYSDILDGAKIQSATYWGGLVELTAGKAKILLGEGLNIRFHPPAAARPVKHQLLIEFSDGSALSGSVQMYGGMGAFVEGQLDNKYYKVAKEKPSPITEAFDRAYFDEMTGAGAAQRISMKALLATDQRIPGLGNGVLQDILLNARLSPKTRTSSLSPKQKDGLFGAIKSTLKEMASAGGRDTEFDLFGRPGGYRTLLSKNTVGKACVVCGTTIKKESYMGGTVYFCEKCQV